MFLNWEVKKKDRQTNRCCLCNNYDGPVGVGGVQPLTYMVFIWTLIETLMITVPVGCPCGAFSWTVAVGMIDTWGGGGKPKLDLIWSDREGEEVGYERNWKFLGW